MSPRRVALLFFAGTLLIQAAWILALPPYRGSDEVDHVYRAASVAHGHWRPEIVRAQEGRGALIPVPRDIVIDAAPVCRSYEYTGPDNCSPVATLPDGFVLSASAAALYNPSYYAVVGQPSRILEGTHAVYAMRVLSAMLCAALFAVCAGAIASWGRTPWPLVGLGLSLTPVAAYSSVVVAPNGMEIISAICVWTGLLGVTSARTPGSRRVAIALVGVGAVILVNARTLGPLWLGLIVLTYAIAFGPRRTFEVICRHPLLSAGAGCATAVAAALGLGWSISTRQLSTLEAYDLPDVSPWGPALREVPLWVFQSIAAFPLRDQPAPMVVYACWIVLFAALTGAALWRGRNSIRLALLVCAALSLAIPFAITVATVTTAGTFWQGRYTLPYSVGVTLLAGVALDDLRGRHRLLGPFYVAGVACVALAQTISPAGVLLKEMRQSPLTGDPRWWTLPVWAVCALAAMGTAVLARSLVRRGAVAVERPPVLVTHRQDDRPES